MDLLNKTLDILTPAQRRSAVFLLGLMLIGVVLETLSIGLALPALSLLTGDLYGSPRVTRFLARLGNPSREHLLLLGMGFLVAVFAVKAMFLAYLAWRQARFVFDLQADISRRLFTRYVHQPYPFHLQRNTGALISNVVTETNLFTHTGLLAVMILLSEGLVIAAICALLFVMEPTGASLVAGTLAAAGWGFIRITRSRLSRWGEARQHHEQLRIQHLQQALGGIKDVKLLGRESDFVRQYDRHNRGSAASGQRQNALAQFPRLWLELLAVVGLAILVAVIVAQGQSLASLLPTLGLFAAAAFRLMPSANRIVTSIQHMRYAMPVAALLHSELQLSASEVTPARTTPLPFRNELTLESVSYRYPEAESNALAGISVAIARGTSVGFIGGSGAGKSTLVDVVLGLLTPSSGRVVVDGVDIQTNLRGWQDQIGYVAQTIFLTDDTLRRNVAFGIPDDEIDDERVWRALRSAQLDAFVRSLPDVLDARVGERGVRLSGGQRQRVGIARALYHEPAVLVLDEATSALDVVTERGVMDAVQALHGSKTVVVVAHRLTTIERCDRVFRIENGELVDQGDPHNILQAERMRAIKQNTSV